jgi:hypothetical protein
MSEREREREQIPSTSYVDRIRCARTACTDRPAMKPTPWYRQSPDPPTIGMGREPTLHHRLHELLCCHSESTSHSTATVGGGECGRHTSCGIGRFRSNRHCILTATRIITTGGGIRSNSTAHDDDDDNTTTDRQRGMWKERRQQQQ